MFFKEKELRAFFKENYRQLVDLMITICKIPAPSHKEERRAAFCKDWLEKIGAQGVYIDEAQIGRAHV